LGIGKKLVVLIGISTILVVEGVFLLTGFIIQSIWTCVIASAVLAFTFYYFYIRLYRKKEAKYPVVPPEGRTDIYFPRTDIPRPVYADLRKMQEKKQKLEKIKKKMRHKNKLHN
jgi:predicted tellurium resistance membrane protein TerC